MFASRRMAWGSGLAALVLSAIAGPGASAGWLGFRNDLGHPVILQAVTDKGLQGKPLYLQPGESTCDWVNDNAVRKITVQDARERPPRPDLTRFETSPAKEDALYILKFVTKDGKKVVEVTKTSDVGRKKK
jgi:hypothetical protein